MILRILFVALVMLAIGCRIEDPDFNKYKLTDTADASSHTSVATPCVHEACEERPDRLRCVGWNAAWNSCDEWAVEYKRRCNCDRWDLAPIDGGKEGAP